MAVSCNHLVIHCCAEDQAACQVVHLVSVTESSSVGMGSAVGACPLGKILQRASLCAGLLQIQATCAIPLSW